MSTSKLSKLAEMMTMKMPVALRLDDNVCGKALSNKADFKNMQIPVTQMIANHVKQSYTNLVCAEYINLRCGNLTRIKREASRIFK